MGSEINSERSRNAQELRDLQESYRKKKQETKEAAEQDLEATRRENRAKIDSEKRGSDAVINHLREDNKTRIEQMREAADRKVTYERGRTSQRVDNEKAQGDAKVESLEKAIANRQKALQKTQAELKEREGELRQRESEDTANIVREHVERRQQIAKQSAAEMNDLNTRMQKSRSELERKHAEEMRKLTEEHRGRSEGFKKESQETYQRQRAYSQGQLRAEEESHGKRLEAERAEFLRKQAEQKKIVSEALHKEKTEGEGRLTEIQSENKRVVEQERLRGADGVEKTRKVYADEVARQHKTGDKALAEQKSAHEFRMNRLLEAQEAEANEIQAKHQQQLADEDQRYRTEAQRNSLFYKEALLQKHKEYEAAQKRNFEAFANHIQLQKENMTKSLEKEKREALDTVGKYRERQGDPFYRLNGANADISETENYVIIRAAVPEHEKDNVKLFVRDDKAVIQGHRKFQDEIKDESGRLTTSNFQTFRQEFLLPRPVHEKLAERAWENGILTLKIPKV